MTSMMKVPGHDIVVHPDTILLAKQAFQPPNNVQLASSSPEKTQIKIFRGRVGKVTYLPTLYNQKPGQCQTERA